MTEFLQSNFTLLIGAAVVLGLVAVRGGTSDKQLRRDLRGPVVFFILFLVLRSLGWLLDEHISRSWLRAFRVGWMLLFAFGSIRSAVSLSLWLLRLRTQKPTPKILRDVLDGTLYVMAAVPILRTQLQIDLTGLLATSAILSIVLGLALQETLGNLFSGLSLQLERPFQVGDWVSIGQHIGQVAQVAWRATRIETIRNESITLPNNIVSKEPVKNFSRGVGIIGVDIFVRASMSAPPNRVKQILRELVAETPKALPFPEPTFRMTKLAETHIEYMIRCFVPSFADREDLIEAVLTGVWYRFRREGIEIPLPQQVLHFAPQEAPRTISDGGKLALLRSVDLFETLSDKELSLLAADGEIRLFGRNERVLSEGDAGQTFYVVVSGEVSVSVGKPEVEVTRLRRGQYFGEMSLLTGEARAATVTTLEDTTLLELDRPTFARLFAENPGLDRQLSALLAQRRAELRARSETPQRSSTEEAPDAGRILTRLKGIFSR